VTFLARGGASRPVAFAAGSSTLRVAIAMATLSGVATEMVDGRRGYAREGAGSDWGPP
jgi:RNA 3'-terminal phosphate cyclase